MTDPGSVICGEGVGMPGSVEGLPESCFDHLAFKNVTFGSSAPASFRARERRCPRNIWRQRRLSNPLGRTWSLISIGTTRQGTTCRTKNNNLPRLKFTCLRRGRRSRQVLEPNSTSTTLCMSPPRSIDDRLCLRGPSCTPIDHIDYSHCVRIDHLQNRTTAQAIGCK